MRKDVAQNYISNCLSNVTRGLCENVSDLVSTVFKCEFLSHLFMKDESTFFFCGRHLSFLEILMFGNQMPHSPQREVLFWVWGPWGKFLKCALIFTLDCIGFRELFCKERRQWSIAQGNSAKISPRRRKLSCQKAIIDCGHCQGIPNYELLSIMFAFYWCRDPLIKRV